jgi:hypothetical protein
VSLQASDTLFIELVTVDSTKCDSATCTGFYLEFFLNTDGKSTGHLEITFMWKAKQLMFWDESVTSEPDHRRPDLGIVRPIA